MTLTQGDIEWDAVFPEDCKIFIEQRGTETPIALCSRVTNFEDGGGAQDTESVPHFCNAFITVTKPQEEFEVSFDVSMKDTLWAQIMSDDVTVALGSISGSTLRVRSGGDRKRYKIKLEWKDSAGSDGYKIIYYNAYGVTFEKSSPADDRLTATVSFNLSPTSSIGSGQKVEVETSALFDVIAGSPTGSYVQYENDADTVFGYGVGSMS